MPPKTLQVTKSGLATLQTELEELMNIKRPKLVERLAYARSQGDLSENSDYINAKEDLEFLDGRIEELQEVMKNSRVVGGSSGNKVSLGAKVTLKVNGQRHEYEIVGEWEADPVNKKISPESPLGRALVGKAVGEKATVEAPAGQIIYEVVSISG